MINTNRNSAAFVRSLVSPIAVAGFCVLGTLSLTVSSQAQGLVENSAINSTQAGAVAQGGKLGAYDPGAYMADALSGAGVFPAPGPSNAPASTSNVKQTIIPAQSPSANPTATDTTSVSATNPPVPRWNVKEMLNIDSVPRVKKYSSVYLLDAYGVTLLDAKPKVFISNAQRKKAAAPAAAPQY